MLAVIDSRTPVSACDELRKMGVDLCPLPIFSQLDPPVSGHPDMLLFFAQDAIICSKSYAQIAEPQLQRISAHTKLPIVLTEQSPLAEYPHDIALNAAIIGEKLLCFPKYTAKEITDRFEGRVLSVRQGYAKCSTLPIEKRALITEDPTIEKVARQNGFDVLKIRSDSVRLDGYSTGFFGGATSYSPYRELDFILCCGDLDTHPDAEKIRVFCQKYNQKIISLGNFPLYDVGTIFLL